MKSKLLITMTSMFIGGAERSLIGFLNSIDYSNYEVDLFLFRKEGEFLKYIPSSVNILPEIKQYNIFDIPFIELLKRKHLLIILLKLISKMIIIFTSISKKNKDNAYRTMQLNYFLIVPLLPMISKKKYDISISYLGIHNILIKKINAKVKIGWLHTDYKQMCPFIKLDRKIWEKLEFAINVSKECENSFLEIHPSLKNKSIVFENILSSELIYKQSIEFDANKELDSENCIKLCSIGRFCYAKNFDNIPFIMKILKEMKKNIKWYIIGYGGDENLIRSNIEKTNTQNEVIILGKKINPYPYLKSCDIYVQPSRFEGKAVAVREAQILNKPVIITNYKTSASQLKNGYDGIIVAMDNLSIANGIYNLINDKDKQNELINNMKTNDYTNYLETSIFLDFISNQGKVNE